MICRTWHGPVPAARADEYHGYLLRTGVQDYRATPGNCGVLVLRHVDGETAHFLLTTCWHDLGAVQAFAGKEIDRARYYPHDALFLLAREPFVAHHAIRRLPPDGLEGAAGNVVRRWCGWTDHDAARDYERLLLGEVIPGIEARRLPGYQGTTVLRRETAQETEFVTLMGFSGHDAVRAFAGDGGTRAVVPPAAARLLARYDAHAVHYDRLPTGAA